METLYKLQWFFLIINIFAYTSLKAYFERDIYIRLDSKYTHKEARKIKNDILKMPLKIRKNFIKEFELLDNTEFPKILKIFKKSSYYLMIISLFLIVISYIFSLIWLSVVNSVISISEILIYFLYRIIEYKNALKTIPKLRKAKELRFADKYPIKQKKKINKKEQAIIIRAIILRYSIIIPMLFSSHYMLMAVSMLIYSIIFFISALIECEEFYCAMMDINHISMKPYKCSHSWRKKAYKEGIQVSILLIVMSILMIIAGLYCS